MASHYVSTIEEEPDKMYSQLRMVVFTYNPSGLEVETKE